VKYYEKGDRPLEYVTTRQWFVRLLPHKTALLEKGDAIRWHPDFMRLRYRNWTEGLQIDWCISRQRFFGVPIPVWYPVREDGSVDHERPILAPASRLPVDPLSDAPPGFAEVQRGKPGGFVGDPDVFDTWFTSSLTPQIGSGWRLDPERHRKLFPADIRPQSHEIIRTWAFYTIAKSLLHEGSVPWHHVVVSGWILDPDRKKMSKSAGNVVTPIRLIDEYGADGVRYWAASARLGMDTAFDEKVLKVGKRLVTKIFNAGKFVLSQSADPGDITEELDRAFVAELRALIAKTTDSFEMFDYAHALQETEQFFWARFTDTYLELAKPRARGDVGNAAARSSAVATLRLGLDILLRLFAPFLPYVTEEVWSWAFAQEKSCASVHIAPWPTEAELERVRAPASAVSLPVAIEAMSAINKAKTERGASVGRVVERLLLRANEGTASELSRVLSDVLACTRVREHRLEIADVEGVVVADIELVPKAEESTAS
jgi:valyl-tRNA synthetase